MVGLIGTKGTHAEWTFPAEAGAVRRARHTVRDALQAWGVDARVTEAAVLLVSELVTNSLRYTPGPIGVGLALVEREPGAPGNEEAAAIAESDDAPLALLVEVSDPLPDPPALRTSGPDDEGGRGLTLVACSSRRWGTRRGKTGKTVWFELPLPG